MPSDWLYIDTAFPSFTGQESPDKKIDTIQNYLYMLVEQLRYSLRNLDFNKNMNQAAVEQFTGEITQPIYLQIGELGEGVNSRMEEINQDLSGKISINASAIEQTATNITAMVVSVEEDLSGRIEVNASTIEQTATSITTRVEEINVDLSGKIEANTSEIRQTAEDITATVTSVQGDVSKLQQTASSLTTEVSNAKKDISTLQQTATSLSTEIKNAKGDVSKLEQKVDGFTLSVTNKTGSSTISLKSGGATICTSGDITLGGDVIFKANLKDGTTVISGDNIKTGKIKADYIDVDTIKLKYLYGPSGSDPIIDASGSSTVTIGTPWPLGSGSIQLGGRYICLGKSSGSYVLVDTYSHTMIPTATGNTWDLGSSGKRWSHIYAATLNATIIDNGPSFPDGATFTGYTLFGDAVTMNKDLTVSGTGNLAGNAKVAGSGKSLGFFGSLGTTKRTVSSTADVATLISALKAYGLIG